MKPLFYMLASRGPWSHHVRFFRRDYFESACNWLAVNKKQSDYEIFIKSIEHKATETTTFQNAKGNTVNHKSIEPVILFNDPKLASFVKLSWGGK